MSALFFGSQNHRVYVGASRPGLPVAQSHLYAAYLVGMCGAATVPYFALTTSLVVGTCQFHGPTNHSAAWLFLVAFLFEYLMR